TRLQGDWSSDVCSSDLLLTLAEYGSKLAGLILGNVGTSVGQTGLEWFETLTSELKQSATIQVARTGPAQYVFPWDLVYDYPLPRSEERRVGKSVGVSGR